MSGSGDSLNVIVDGLLGFPIPVPFGGTGGTSFPANLPLIGAGTGPLAQGTVSGNTTTFATTSGALVAGNCVQSDSDGNLVDAAAACGGGGGGSGTVTAGTANELAYYAGAG